MTPYDAAKTRRTAERTVPHQRATSAQVERDRQDGHRFLDSVVDDFTPRETAKPNTNHEQLNAVVDEHRQEKPASPDPDWHHPRHLENTGEPLNHG